MTDSNTPTHLHTHVELNPNVKAALLHPQRSMEVRGWLKTHHDVAKYWRGDDRESMMHWAFLSDWVLASELKEIGLSFQDKDGFGRTPMDWINDRLWGAVVDEKTNHQLSAGGKERLRRQTETQVVYLWNQGARPSLGSDRLPAGVVWMRAGAWGLLDLLIDPDDADVLGWKNWTPNGGHALHALVLAPNMPARRQFIKTWLSKQQAIDCVDSDGRTPLWYAADAWLSAPQWRHHLEVVVKELVASGASVDMEDKEGFSPRVLIANSQEPDVDKSRMLKAMGLPTELPDDDQFQDDNQAPDDLLDLIARK